MQPIFGQENPSTRPFAASLQTLFHRNTVLFILVAILVSSSFQAYAQLQLPTSVDNSAGLPPVGNQGSQKSSHAWALAYYYKTYQEGRAHAWDLTVPQHQFSPAFLYNQVAPFNEGTSFLELSGLLLDEGCATLADSPYIDSDFTSWPSYTAFRNAIPFRAQSVRRLGDGLTPGIIQAIKTLLAGKELCVIEVPIFSPNAQSKGLFERLDATNYFYEMPADDDVYLASSQALTIVGYDDSAFSGNGGFKVVNSWGTDWGSQGFAYLSYEFIQAFAPDVYTMKARGNYQPSSFARFKLAHPFWGLNHDNVTVTIGVGNEASPLWSRVILTGLERESLTVDMAVDLTDAAAFLPPTFIGAGGSKWTIKAGRIQGY